MTFTWKLRLGYPYDTDDAEREDLEAPDDALRVVRGGSFNNYELNLRAADRDRYDPDFRDVSVGFRVVFSRLRS